MATSACNYMSLIGKYTCTWACIHLLCLVLTFLFYASDVNFFCSGDYKPICSCNHLGWKLMCDCGPVACTFHLELFLCAKVCFIYFLSHF